MAYRPYVFTSTAAAQKAVGWDPKRTNLVITNVSGETVYMGADATVATSGAAQGAPIFYNGQFQASWGDGTDPTVERWLIGTAGGTINIFEDFAPDPSIAELKYQNKLIEQVIVLLKQGAKK